ncbi:MAG: fasciclin domain-containing protein [Planctomycetaceae bacterium]|nr:fasciclin domain-containing protein [Planctomycetaceae bacterium]
MTHVKWISLGFATLAMIGVAGMAWAQADAAAKDIVETAKANENLTTLVKALAAADLVETLKGAGPYTVFAPTNAAFDKLPAGKLDELLKPENKAELQKVLKCHVVEGKLTAKDLAGKETLKSLSGEELKISTKDGKTMVNDATVTTADVEASNGVVHLIDTVLMPK